MAHTAVWKVKEKLISLSDIAEITADRGRVSVLLTTLQGLSKPDIFGQDPLKGLFDSANIKLMDQMSEENRDDAKLVTVLKDYELSFLMPLLTIRQEMAKQLAAEPRNADSLAKWIHENVPSKFHTQADFVVALFSVVFSHIVTSTTMPPEETEGDKALA